MSTRDSNDDHERNRLVCKPWDGSRSSAFRTQFLRDFSLGADAKYGHDDDHSLWAAMTDNDQYGSGPLAEAGPAQGQAGYKNAKMREKKRHNAAIKMISDHILDERLKDMIKDKCTSARKGTEAWALILSECSEEATDLHVLDEKKRFAGNGHGGRRPTTVTSRGARGL